MAYPFDNTSPNMGYQPELSLSGLGQYGMAVPQLPTQQNALTVDVAPVPVAGQAGGTTGGLFSSMSNLLGGIFNQRSAFGDVDANGVQSMGWAAPAASLASALFSFQQGRETQQIARDNLKESQRQFNLNYGAQRQNLNTELEDRQRARVASAGGSGAYESVDSYMNRNRIR